MNKIKTFIKNLKYLSKINLKEFNTIKQNISDFKEHVDFEQKLYEINSSLVFYPKIKNFEETVKELQEGNKSMSRLGDGEFAILEKNSIPFQQYNLELEKRLREILHSNDENIDICISYIYFNILNINLTQTGFNFIRSYIGNKRALILNSIDLNKTYYSAEITQLYNILTDYDFVNYFKEIQKIWDKKDVLIVSGESVFNNIEHNIFDNTSKLTYYKAPSVNAFNKYDEILKDVIKTASKDTLIIIILGPTATVLAYDLHKAGYRALDLGHIAKDYDYFMKKIERNDKNIINFFKPD